MKLQFLFLLLALIGFAKAQDSELRLGARYLLQTLFLAPTTESCGMASGDIGESDDSEGSGSSIEEDRPQGVKYYDCEKLHTRLHVIKSLRKFFEAKNQNLGSR